MGGGSDQVVAVTLPSEQLASSCAPGCHCESIRRARDQAWAEIRLLRRATANQGRLISHLHPETHPAAPSLNACYWLFSLAHDHERSWRHKWNRLLPSLRGLGTLPAPEVTPLAWARHLAHRKHEPDRFGNPPCAHTMNMELSHLKGLLEWTVENQILPFNPLRSAKRLAARSQRETRLSPLDVDRLLLEAEGLRSFRQAEEDDDGHRSKMLQAAILVWHDSMLRFNEGRHLRRDLIQENGDYAIPRDTTKTDAGERTVTLTPRTLDAIRAVPVHPETDYIFVNPRSGKMLSEGTLRGWFRWACAGSRMDAKAAPRDKRIVPHHLRHAGATTADANGARAGALQTALGHSHPAATARYIHRDKAESAHHVAEIIASATVGVRRSPKRAMGGRPEKAKQRSK